MKRHANITFVHGYLYEKLTWTKTCKIIIFVSCKGHEQTSFIDEWMKNHTNVLFVYGHFMRNWNGWLVKEYLHLHLYIHIYGFDVFYAIVVTHSIGLTP